MPAVGDNQPDANAYDLARFSDRFAAFSLDALVFCAGYAGVLFLRVPSLGIPTHPRFGILWACIWTGLFLTYHACLSAQGRQTLGKRLMGLRVCTVDGEDLGFGRSLLRSTGYIPSALFLQLGFLWALIHPDHAAWHDLLAGTRVVDIRGQGRPMTPMRLAAGWALAGLFVLFWLLIYIAGPQFARRQDIASAEDGLYALALLEEMHHKKTGAYTSDIGALARLYGRQDELMHGLSQIIDMKSLRVEGDQAGYRIEADVLGLEKIAVRIEGPVKKP